MQKWLILTLFVAALCQQSSASCRFFVDQFFGYTCELNDVEVTSENEVLLINTDNHLPGQNDSTVRAFQVGNAVLRFFPNSILGQFSDLYYLFLSDSGLTALHTEAFVGGENIGLLTISNTPLTTIPAGVLDPLTNLGVLDLSGNQINEIHEDAFVNNVNLIDLELYNNMIERIPGNLLRNQRILENLGLYENRISEIEDGAFSQLDNLIIFYLRDNLITELRPEMFASEILSLVYFDLNNNLLTSVPRLPTRAPSLKYIYLIGNHIEEINVGDFSFAYSNITNIELTDNRLTVLSGEPFEVLENLNTLRVERNRINLIDHELFDRVPSLYTFYMEGNACASVRFNNIRSIDQEQVIQDTLDHCFYNFFEPQISAVCNFSDDDDTRFGYTCALSDITFLNFRDKFTLSGTHMSGRTNEDVTGIRVLSGEFARIPPTIFRTFPNLRSASFRNTDISVVERKTFIECGQLSFLDLSRNRIRRLVQRSFENCFYIDELILDDNQIAEVEPCGIFLLNIYQTRRLSLRNNVCIDTVLYNYYDSWLINDLNEFVNPYMNRCYSLFYLFLDTQQQQQQSR